MSDSFLIFLGLTKVMGRVNTGTGLFVAAAEGFRDLADVFDLCAFDFCCGGCTGVFLVKSEAASTVVAVDIIGEQEMDGDGDDDKCFI